MLSRIPGGLDRGRRRRLAASGNGESELGDPSFCQGGMSCAATPLASDSAQHPEDSQHRDCDDPNDDQPLHPLEPMPSSHRALGDLMYARGDMKRALGAYVDAPRFVEKNAMTTIVARTAKTASPVSRARTMFAGARLILPASITPATAVARPPTNKA